jgi:hypothetical protein
MYGKDLYAYLMLKFQKQYEDEVNEKYKYIMKKKINLLK